MRFFFDATQRPARSEFRLRETPAYYELETLLNDPEVSGASYLYVVPQSSTAVLVLACWGRDPDAMVGLFSDPNLGKDWFSVFCETYPIQGKLFLNGFEERYSEGALVRLEDPDDGEPKWFVATIVGNIVVGGEPDNPNEANAYGLIGAQRFLAHTRMGAAYELVTTLSFAAAQEFATKEISTLNKAKLYAKGAWNGYLQGLDDNARWMQRLNPMGY